MSLSLLSSWKFLNKHLKLLFSFVVLGNFVLGQKTIAAPENFNPNLEFVPEIDVEDNNNSNEEEEEEVENIPKVKPSPPIKPKTAAPSMPLPAPTLSNESSIESGTADIELKNKTKNQENPGSSLIDVDNIKFDFQLDFDSFGQANLLIDQQIDFNLYNLDFFLDIGVNLFKQDEIETVNNIPLYLSWATAIGKTDLTLTGGVDFFDRLAAVPRFSLKASRPLFSSITEDSKLKSLFVLSAQVQYQAYKFNAETLENEIDFWRFTPSIYWQIQPNLSLFTLGQYGILSDGNRDFQSFSRLERKFGPFSVAANLFTWSFEQDLGSINGYFSPPDFIVYNGELAWQGTMFDELLDCKLSGAVGKQSVNGATDNAWTYKALCAAQLLENVELDFSYTYSNVRDRNTGNTSFGNQSVTGSLNIDL